MSVFLDQGNTVTSSAQTEDIFDRSDESDPTTGQVKRDAQIEDHDPAVQVCPVLTTIAIDFDTLSLEGCCE